MFVDFAALPPVPAPAPRRKWSSPRRAFAVLVDILDATGHREQVLGDGFLALFGAPFEAHDAAHHAVAAAPRNARGQRAAQQATSWPLRIGIGACR